MTKKERKKNSLVSLEDKWSKCLSCKYNRNKSKKELKIGDFQLFNCFADVDEFPCELIPELYPHKILEGLDGKTIESDEDFELYPYVLEMYDSINDNITRIIVAASSKESIEKRFAKVVKHKVYRHLLLYKVIKLQDLLEELFKNHTVLVLPNEVNKVVFPEIDIELAHYGEPVKIKELTYDLRRYPGADEDQCKPAHFSVDERLTLEKKEDVGQESGNGRSGTVCGSGSTRRQITDANKHLRSKNRSN